MIIRTQVACKRTIGVWLCVAGTKSEGFRLSAVCLRHFSNARVKIVRKILTTPLGFRLIPEAVFAISPQWPEKMWSPTMKVRFSSIVCILSKFRVCLICGANWGSFRVNHYLQMRSESKKKKETRCLMETEVVIVTMTMKKTMVRQFSFSHIPESF